MKLTKLASALAASFTLSLSIQAADFVPKTEAPALNAISEIAETPYHQETVAEFTPASDQIGEFLESKDGWEEGWDAEKKRMFVTYSLTFNTDNPAYDDSFISKRSMRAMSVILGAKMEVIRYMREEMSAIDQVSAPGTDVHAELNKKYLDLEKKITFQQTQFLKLLEQSNAAEAKAIKGVTFGDRINLFADALIKKLDESYDAGQIEQQYQEKFEKTKAEYLAAKQELEALEQEAQNIKGETKESASSVVSTMAKAPLLGAVVLAQAESYNEEEQEYEMSVLLVWSPKLEKAAQAINAGTPVNLKPKNGKTVQEWLKTQEVATLVGPRQYVDKDGRRWFIGTYAMPYEGSGSTKNKNKRLANTMARKEAAMALYADLAVKEEAEQLMQTKSAGLGEMDHTEIASSLAMNMKQSIENRQVNGLSKLLSKTVVHPISNQKIYVAAYGVSSDSAVQARQLEKSSYKAAALSNKANEINAANKRGMDNALEKSKQKVATPHVSLTQSAEEAKLMKAGKKPAAKGTKSATKPGAKTNSLLNAPEVDDDDF